MICETIEDLAQMEIDSLVAADNYTDDSLSEDETNVDDCQTRAVITADEQSCMEMLLRECNFNWFELVDKFEEKKHLLNAFYDDLPMYNFTEREFSSPMKPFMQMNPNIFILESRQKITGWRGSN